MISIDRFDPPYFLSQIDVDVVGPEIDVFNSFCFQFFPEFWNIKTNRAQDQNTTVIFEDLIRLISLQMYSHVSSCSSFCSKNHIARLVGVLPDFIDAALV